MLCSCQGHINASVVRNEITVRSSHSGKEYQPELSSLGLVNGEYLLSQLVSFAIHREVQQCSLYSLPLRSIRRNDSNLIWLELLSCRSVGIAKPKPKELEDCSNLGLIEGRGIIEQLILTWHINEDKG
jgi:hypothetical protein